MARIDPMLMNSVGLLTDTDANALGTAFLYGYPSDDLARRLKPVCSDNPRSA